jgi:hypothetical protein
MNMYMGKNGKYYAAEAPNDESDVHIVSPRPELLAQIRGGESIAEDELVKMNEANANGVVVVTPGSGGEE